MQPRPVDIRVPAAEIAKGTGKRRIGGNTLSGLRDVTGHGQRRRCGT
jgi:hypothetical protein